MSLTQKQRTHVDPWPDKTMMLVITLLYSQGRLRWRSNPLKGRSRSTAPAVFGTGVEVEVQGQLIQTLVFASLMTRGSTHSGVHQTEASNYLDQPLSAMFHFVDRK